MTKKLNPLDASWLQVESRDTPMHVAQLQIFSLPDDAPEGFVLDLVARAKASKELQEPWNLKLRGGRALPVWIDDNNVDMDYHFRHLSVPRPGGERELGVLVSLLHSTQLDLSRPLWECTIIEGLEGNRVALYTKIHHSLVDGVSGARMMSRVFSPDPNERNMVAPWRVPPPEKTRREKLPAAPAANPMQVIKEQFGAKVKSASSLISALRRLRRAKKTPGDALVGPFTGPKSVLNGRVNQARRFATQQYDLAELKALAAKADCSLNDIVLYLCATALRRFLERAGPVAESTADRRHSGERAAGGRPVHRQCDQLHHGDTGHRHLRSTGTARRDQGVHGPRQGTPAGHAEIGTDPVHDDDHGPVHTAATDRPRRPRKAGVQHHHLQRPRPGPAAVLEWREAGSDLPGVADRAWWGTEYHLPVVRRDDELRLHRLPRHACRICSGLRFIPGRRWRNCVS